MQPRNKEPQILEKREIKLSVFYTPDLPEESLGATVLTAPTREEYAIILNANYPEEWLETFLHECCHIWRRDLLKQGESIQTLEDEVDRIVKDFCENDKTAVTTGVLDQA